jgi:hypothetical protein
MCERILRIHRIDQTLRRRLQSMGPDAGRVLKVWSRGACVVDPNGRPIYLFGRMPLHVPFGVALDCDENISAALVGWQEGGQLIQRGNRLRLSGTTGPGIALDTGTTVDLRWNEESRRLPLRWIPKSIQALCRVLVSHGNFQGLVGVLGCLKSQYPDIPMDTHSPVNQYVRHVMGPVQRLLEARSGDLPAAFLRVSLDLVGCGPGLTPSGDDFLVGFLAAHQLCSSSLARDTRKRKWGLALVELARKQTTLISSELLACAVEGRFSEVLRQTCLALCHVYGHLSPGNAVQRLLNWGSTSGTDTLVGLTIGLATAKS